MQERLTLKPYNVSNVNNTSLDAQRKAQGLCFNIITRMMNVSKDQSDIQFPLTGKWNTNIIIQPIGKDFIIYADFEAINRILIGQAFAEVEELNYYENKNVTAHEIVSAQYIIIVNDNKLNFREEHPMFGKTFLFKGSNQKAVLRTSKASEIHAIH